MIPIAFILFEARLSGRTGMSICARMPDGSMMDFARDAGPTRDAARRCRPP